MVDVDIPSPDDSGKTVSPQTHVYVITAESDAVKIGVAKNVPRRLKELQTGQHRKLSIFHEHQCSRADAYAIECRAHRVLKEHLMEGEWFSVPAEDGKRAVERAISDLDDERQKKAEESKSKGPVYEPPLIVEMPGERADELSAFDIARRVAPDKKEVVVLFEDRAIFVARGADNKKTGSPTYLVNDVTRWYIQDKEFAA
jgi:hypothetical protein